MAKRKADRELNATKARIEMERMIQTSNRSPGLARIAADVAARTEAARLAIAAESVRATAEDKAQARRQEAELERRRCWGRPNRKER